MRVQIPPRPRDNSCCSLAFGQLPSGPRCWPGGRPPDPPDPPDPPRRPRRFRYLAVGLVELRGWLLAVSLAGLGLWLLAVGCRGWLLAVGLVEVGLWLLAVGLSARRFRLLAVGLVGRWLRIPDFWNLGGAGRGGSSAGPIGRQRLYVMAHPLMVAPLMQGRQDFSAGTKEISCFGRVGWVLPTLLLKEHREHTCTRGRLVMRAGAHGGCGGASQSAFYYRKLQ